MSYPVAPRTLAVALRTGDIAWPSATAHSNVGDEDYNVNYTMPDEEINNQYGFRSRDGKLTTWKKIDLTSLMQGAVSPRTFRIVILERKMLGESDPAGDGTDNPPEAYELYDSYLHVDSSGGSNDRRIKTSYTDGESELIGKAILGGFQTGRFLFNNSAYAEQK